MKKMLMVYCAMLTCKLFAQFPNYDPNHPNPSHWDVQQAQDYAHDQRQKAMEAGIYDATSLKVQEHLQHARDAEYAARMLEDRMRQQQMRQEEEERRMRQQSFTNPNDTFGSARQNPTVKVQARNISIALPQTEEPKVAEYCLWNVAIGSYTQKKRAKREFVDAYRWWFRSMGYFSSSTMMWKVEKLFDTYAKDYDDGMFLTEEPNPDDYTDKARFIKHFLNFKLYVPNGIRNSIDRSTYFSQNRENVKFCQTQANLLWAMKRLNQTLKNHVEKP